ncbi:nitrogen fixation protein NifM [uncultured Lamprocystis sp.]|jgi:peptidyl-prolyl cis-trans isomerase C|uniref:nitrogen fixation protein NifM n=1 Tax=uncultured Lamprocystis sp. TaxID=543132 RepID=UPI0025CDAF76|nr:nitrogen fixation protein NifM [uncultured Lamprocystis sp.]
MSAEALNHPAEFRYHLLRAAGERFQLGTWALDDAQRAEAMRLAQRTFELETLVLGSAQARAVVIPLDQVEAAVGELRSRYTDADDFVSDLERNALDLVTLRSALRRELTFDAAMRRVGDQRLSVDAVDEQLFFELHQDRFTVPERRGARHILITVNDAFAENGREVVRARMDRLVADLDRSRVGRPERFAVLAREQSECPTALQDGRLGEVRRGQLYPALDAVLFAMAVGEISGPVESELGFHLLLCEHILLAHALQFTEAQPQIRLMLEERQRRRSQTAWIAELRLAAAGDAAGPTAPAAQAWRAGQAA